MNVLLYGTKRIEKGRNKDSRLKLCLDKKGILFVEHFTKRKIELKWHTCESQQERNLHKARIRMLTFKDYK